MSITLTKLTDGSSSGAGPFVTASISPPAGKTAIIFLLGDGFSAVTGSNTVAGCGATWDTLATHHNAGDPNIYVQLLYANTTFSTGTLSITPPQSMSQFKWCVFYADGIDTTGANGINGFYQNVGADSRDSGTAANWGPTLGTLHDATNDMVVMCFQGAGNAGTPTSDPSATALEAQGTNATDFMGVEYYLPPTTTPVYKSTGNFEYLNAIAFELKAAGGGGSTPQPQLMMMGMGS